MIVKDELHIIRVGERGMGKTHAFALQLEEIANSRRDLFIGDLERKIKDDLYRREDLLGVLTLKNGKNSWDEAQEAFLKGIISSYKSILNYIAEQKKLFTYHDTDPTTTTRKEIPNHDKRTDH